VVFIGRLPLFAAAGFPVAIALIVTVAVAIHFRSVAKNAVSRGVWSAVAVLSLIASPVPYTMLSERFIAAALREGMYIDLPPHPWLPACFATAVLIAARLLFPARGTRMHTQRWRTAAVIAAIVFTFLNVANVGNPGWIGWFGFPLPYELYSDAMFTLNGDSGPRGLGPIAIVANIALFATVAISFSLYYRRSVS